MNTLDLSFYLPNKWYQSLVVRSLILERDGDKRELNLHDKLNNSNWAMWKSMMEDFLTIKDLSDSLDSEEIKPKDISY